MGRKRASQVDETGQRINCKVCGSSAVGRRCGAVVCEACKKFFIRNRNSLPKLRCVNETGHQSSAASVIVKTELDTSMGDDSVGAIAEQNPAPPEKYCEITPNNRCCSRCRIIKCLELGMRMKGKKSNKPVANTGIANSIAAAAASPGFSIASPASVSVLKEHSSVYPHLGSVSTVDTPSASDPNGDSTYIPKKLRATAMASTSSSIGKPSPFNASSSAETTTPPWYASPSPPSNILHSSPFSVPTNSGGLRNPSFDQAPRSLPVFPGLLPGLGPIGPPSDRPSPPSGSPPEISPPSSSSRLPPPNTLQGFLAYQKFARDFQQPAPGINQQQQPRQSSSPTNSVTSPFSAGPSTYVPPTSIYSFLTTSPSTSATSPTSPSWALFTGALLRSQPPPQMSTEKQQSNDGAMDQDDNQPQPLPIPDAPPNIEAMANEAMLRGIVRAFPSLQFSSKQLEMSLNPSQPAPSPSQLWQSLMTNFENGVGMGLSYVKALPGIRHINLKDRTEIFSDSFLPMAAAQQLMDAPSTKNDGFFLNMNQEMRNLFLSYFPAYSTLAREVQDIGEALSGWNPSFIEFVFLEAMLFYRSDVPNLQNPMAVLRLRNRLTRTLEAYLQKTCRTEDDANKAMSQFYSVYGLLMRLPDVHNAVLSQTAKEHPEIFGVSSLLGELYSGVATSTSGTTTPNNVLAGASSTNYLVANDQQSAPINQSIPGPGPSSSFQQSPQHNINHQVAPQNPLHHHHHHHHHHQQQQQQQAQAELEEQIAMFRHHFQQSMPHHHSASFQQQQQQPTSINKPG